MRRYRIKVVEYESGDKEYSVQLKAELWYRYYLYLKGGSLGWNTFDVRFKNEEEAKDFILLQIEKDRLRNAKPEKPIIKNETYIKIN